jgi:hypothetical protein
MGSWGIHPHTLNLTEISGSHGNGYEDDCQMGCCAVPTFRIAMMAAVSTSETSINAYETTRRNIPNTLIFVKLRRVMTVSRRLHVSAPKPPRKEPVYGTQVGPQSQCTRGRVGSRASVREAGWAPGTVYGRQGGPHSQCTGGRVGPRASVRGAGWAPGPVYGTQGRPQSQCTRSMVSPRTSVREAGWDPEPVYRRRGRQQSRWSCCGGKKILPGNESRSSGQ